MFESPLIGSGLIPGHVQVTIFSNVRQLQRVQDELAAALASEGVGDAFLRIAPFLKLYSTYANNHERALATLMVSF